MTTLPLSSSPFWRPIRPEAGSPRHKRIFDLVLIAVMIPVLVPVMLAVMAAVALSGPGPIFFVQTRIGHGGQPFRMIKFRSMHVDAEARRAALIADSERAGVCFKMRHDPRVTPVGRLLRRTSLDELPQLINVVKGEMSLVGPRPALPEEVATYDPLARGRLAALPGLTGLWQVSGRADVAFDQMVAMDLDYVARASLRTDLRILWATISAVISGRGAY